MGQEINIAELEEEAVEVNRLYVNWQMLRTQHRERVLNALDVTLDPEGVKRLVKILTLTLRKEEGVREL